MPNTPNPQTAKAEALLLHFAAEAHRRKWSYDRGLDDDGVPIKSEAFDALHRLGEEMRTALEELRRTPAVVPSAAETTNRAALRDRIRRAVCEAEGFGWDTDMLEPDEYGEVADAVLAVLPAPVDRAAARAASLRDAADFYERVLEQSLDPGSDPRYCTAVRDIVMGLRRRAAEEQAAETQDGDRAAVYREVADRLVAKYGVTNRAASQVRQWADDEPSVQRPAVAEQPDTQTREA